MSILVLSLGALAGPLAIPVTDPRESPSVPPPRLDHGWDEFDARRLVLQTHGRTYAYWPDIPSVTVEHTADPLATLREGHGVRVLRDGFVLPPREVLQATGGDVGRFDDQIHGLGWGEAAAIGIAATTIALGAAFLDRDSSPEAYGAVIGVSASAGILGLALGLRRRRLATDWEATWTREELWDEVTTHNQALADDLGLPSPPGSPPPRPGVGIPRDPPGRPAPR
ncbi:MAG: hypothetical protein AAF211_07115 [Myxococcota bacterium]